MSTSTNFNDDNATIPPSDEIIAGEYVLGVLDASTRRKVRERIAADPAFARLVDGWEKHFYIWLLSVEPARPSDLVLPAIKARLGWTRPQPSSSAGIWNNVAFWRAASVFAAAAGFAAFVVGLRLPKPPVVPVADEQAAKPVTVLLRDNGTTGWLASIDVASAKVLMVPVPSPADASGLVNELWIIGAGKAPVSLGFVSNEKAQTIAIPANLRAELAVGATLAITLETKTGMPHEAPSGPIVAKGSIRQI